MRVESLFKRLKREYWKIKFLQSTLDTLILILLLNFGAFIAGLSYDLIYLAVIGISFFLLNFTYRVKDYSVEIYEDENSELKEMLRTARDNLNRSDEVSQALFEDVMERARKVTSESIIPSERVFQKLVLVGGLAILTAVSGLVVPSIDPDIDFEQVSEFVQEIDADSDEDFRGNASEVLGDESDLETGSDVEIDIVGEGESFEEGVLRGFEGDAELMYEVSEDQLDEDAELAKKYSLRLNELE